ncbi:hypothetical protein GCM10023176_18480 [Micromonospora coerulea]|uniref:Uncharacterized protein n=1 Tax=Micromonospora coerulea TaxID=47856 RepID=A0ABP8SEJ6_9ACTN
MLAPGRRLICATCPSTHTQPSRAIHAATFWLTTRTGHGSSDVLRSASLTPSPYGPRVDQEVYPVRSCQPARTPVARVAAAAVRKPDT